METTNALVPMDELAALLPMKYDDKQFDAIAAASNFLPYLTLGALNSQWVAEKMLGAGNYGLIKQKKCTDLGDALDVIVLSWQPLAMRSKADPVISVTDQNDPEFRKIIAESEIKDSGCIYGPCFLLYVPKVETFATFFMSSKTARREAPNLKELMAKAATLKSHLIKGTEHKWYGPLITPCSKQIEIPSMADIKDAAMKFQQVPRESNVETVTEGGRAV